MGTIDFISSKPSKKQENNTETSQNAFKYKHGAPFLFHNQLPLPC